MKFNGGTPCECGCGSAVPLTWRDDYRPAPRFIKGHAGRVLLAKPEHLHTSRYRGAGGKREHVAVAERALGRPLPDGAEVHHVNGNPWDNRNQNLVVCQDNAYHTLLHVHQRVRAAGGDPFAERICCSCHELKPIADFYVRKGRKSVGGDCKPCARAYARAYAKREGSHGAMVRA